MQKIEKITEGMCTGCGVCNNICPSDAITMKLNKEGFYEPEICENKCIECGLCKSKCPVNKPEYSNFETPETYAVLAEDDVRMRSSSGGVFELLAKEVLKDKGYVCGVVYKEDYTTQHILISDEKDLRLMQGSKYVMSDVNTVYKEIGQLLDRGKKVLFSGCPCQVAGLNAYLGNKKDNENLVTVDLICHGIPSVTSFKKYLKDVHGNRPIDYIGFKEKEYGWHASMTIDFSDGARYNEPCERDTYFWSYLSGVNKNKACGDCLFAKIPRQGDITIGDYWGINNYKKDLNDGKGTSVVLINNERGGRFFDKVKQYAKKVEQTTLESAIKGNANLVKPPKNHTSRNQFFKNVTSRRFADAATWSYSADRFDVGLVGIPTFPNFGGALTYYALYQTLNEMGYSATIISRPRSCGRPPIMPDKVYEVNPYPANALKLDFKDKDAMSAMNNVCDNFVVGSDQLFNADLYYRFGEIVTLDWVTDNHRKVAYAASFGHDVFWGPENLRAKMAHYMQKFDAFSLREEDGVELAKKSFGVDAEWVLDPVFLCDKSHYEKVANNTNRKSETAHIFAYILDPDENKNNILEKCKTNTGLDVELFSEMLFNPTQEKLDAAQKQFNIPLRQAKIDERLYSLIHSDLIVTDSFHGACFAIIFEKPFIAILNTNRGASRFYTVLNKLKLTDRLVTTYEEFKGKDYLLKERPDFSACREVLFKEKTRCIRWLKEAISPENEVKKAFSSVDIVNEKIKSIEKKNQSTDIKMNALLSDKLFLTVSDFQSYLDMLNHYKNEIIIAVAVKDTSGFEFTESMAEKMKILGCDISLVDKHWKSYIAVFDGGNKIAETISKGEERVAYTGNIGGKAYKVVSRSFRQGNVAAVIIDGIEYAQNRRGVNIVVLDKNTNAVIDTVVFDTHVKNTPCYRFGELSTTSYPKALIPKAPEADSKAVKIEKEENVVEKSANPGISKVNEVLLHNCMAISAGGGCSLDYYIDKGIKKIAIYGTDLLAAFIWEQAYYSDIEVVYLLSDCDRRLDIRFPRTGKIDLVSLSNTSLNLIDVPIIVAEVGNPVQLLELRKKGVSVEKIGELNFYSHCKRFLFDRLLAYKKSVPNLKIAILNMLHANEILNKTEQEKNNILGNPLRNPVKIRETVFYKNGYSDNYIKEVMQLIKLAKQGNIDFVADKKGDYVNVISGYRLTTDNPNDFKNTAYVFGNSICYGVGVHDEYTIASVLQRELNMTKELETSYAVLNCANGGGLNCISQWKSFQYHHPNANDIAVFIMNYGRLVKEIYEKEFIWCDASEVLNRPHDLGEVFIDNSHLNSVGYEACGKLLADKLIKNHIGQEVEEKITDKTQIQNIDVNLGLRDGELKQLDEYINSILQSKEDIQGGKIGSIVMNCNPFTLGHRYLIEESSKKCDLLYIFVVEENKSVFSFEDRMELVKKGTSDLKNVVVVPSGSFIISQRTFEAYFQKEEKKDVEIDASGDINIFAAKIAPALNITVRYAGEEPLDFITNQYNATMRRILPRFGIDFEVIPRKESLGKPISASRVRALLSEKNFDEIKQIVPETTYEYLYNRFSKSKNVLVLGGTRFMGIRLVEKLIEQNHFVTIANRGNNKEHFGKSVSRIVYDRLNIDSVEKALKGKHYDIVFDTSAYSSNAVKNVLSNITCDRYIQVSSVAVYGKHKLELEEDMMDTATLPIKLSDKESNYGIGKRYAEGAALQLFPEVSTTIVRIPFVVEPDNLDNKELNMRLFFYAKHIIKQIPMKVDNMDYCCSFIRTFEEAEFLIYLSNIEEKGVFNMSSKGYVKIKDIINYIEEKSGLKAIYSEEGTPHPFVSSHYGKIGYSFNLERAEKIGYVVPSLDSWIWKLLDHYIELLKAEQI